MHDSTFIISLDFELHWGSFDKHSLSEERKLYYKNTRYAIHRMLEIFDMYNIHSTWATVGMLFHGSKQELESYMPEIKPTYKQDYLSAYQYIANNNLGINEEEDPCHYASSLIHLIASTPNQEIASHSYSHFYCKEPGQTTEQFRADLKAAKKAAEPFNLELKSLVFPRNQFNKEYLKVCAEEGFKVVRTNPADWFWNIESTQNESKWLRFSRGLDAYIPSGDKKTFKLNDLKTEEGVLLLPASRLLRPWSQKHPILNKLRLQRIKREMLQAAKDGECYHLWWHPHNFGWHPGENLRDLEEILKYFVKMKEEYGMESRSMVEVADFIAQRTAEKAQRSTEVS